MKTPCTKWYHVQNRSLIRTYCIAQGTLFRALWWPKWEGNPNKRGYMYTYGSLSGKAIATHSSTLAWKIPWMEEPGRLQPMGSLGVGHDWVTSLSLFTFMHRRRKWQSTPVFLPWESQGRGSLVGCHLWGSTESDMTEVTAAAAAAAWFTLLYSRN